MCSSAWAKGLQNVKDATGTEGIGSTLALCKGSNVTCEVTDYANLRTLNISVVSGGMQKTRKWMEFSFNERVCAARNNKRISKFWNIF